LIGLAVESSQSHHSFS